jgi:hypothetical protein
MKHCKEREGGTAEQGLEFWAFSKTQGTRPPSTARVWHSRFLEEGTSLGWLKWLSKQSRSCPPPQVERRLVLFREQDEALARERGEGGGGNKHGVVGLLNVSGSRERTGKERKNGPSSP